MRRRAPRPSRRAGPRPSSLARWLPGRLTRWLTGGRAERRPGNLALPRQGRLALVLLLVGAGCGPPPDAATSPPTIRLGEDLCTRSGMIIGDLAYAAAYRTRGGDTRPFDDIGAMILYHREHGEDVAAFWVHDLRSREWVRADQASYVVSPYLRTPMGFGVAALGSAAEAQAEAARLAGRVRSFEELLTDPYLCEGGGAHGHARP